MEQHYSSLQGKTALITGCSRLHGIGAAVARAVAAAGANIATTYFQPYDHAMPWASSADEPQQIIEQLQASGVAAVGIAADLRDPAAPAAIFDFAAQHLGTVHILINNAAHSTYQDIDTITADAIDAHYEVNVRGMILLCQQFVRRLPEGAYGRIINLTSGQRQGPMPDELAYAASKGAVEAFTTSLSGALAPRRITVNALDPGITDTGWITPEQRQSFLSQAPMGRLGQPDDAANLIRFLASPEAGWITGQILSSRGGM